MPESKPCSPAFHPQTGGITILVALMLLVLLTIAAIGMSRNSFREIVISGTSRQGAQARNVADAGVEWAICWMDATNAAAASGTAAQLATLQKTLKSDTTGTMAGKPYDPMTQGLYDIKASHTPPTDLSFSTVKDVTQGFNVALTSMGKLPITNQSQGSGPGAFTPAQGTRNLQAPDLWAVRSDAQVTVGTGLFTTTFVHSKELWLSTPADF